MPRRNGADGHGDVATTGRLPRLRARGSDAVALHDARESLRLVSRGGPTAGVVELAREEGALIMALTATDAELEHLERVVGTRLARFGQKDGLAAA